MKPLLIPSPRTIDSLPARTVLKAGLGTSTILPDLDFETYSPAGFVWNARTNKYDGLPNAKEKGLPTVGAACYTEHPEAEVLCLAYNLKDGQGIKQWLPGDESPVDLFAYIASGGLIEAHNCSFERWVWANICVKKYGWPPIKLYQWRDSMAKARAHSLPGALDDLGEVLKLTERKDKRGKALINKFTKPRNPTKNNPAHRIPLTMGDPDTDAFYHYNRQDIRVESEASSRIPDLSPDELAFWLCDQAINFRGVQIDLDSARACIKIIEQTFIKYNARMSELTNGDVPKVSSLPKLKAWLKTNGLIVKSLNEENTLALLERTDLQPHIKEVLQLRADVNSAAVKKLYKMLNQTTRSGRMHDLFIYHAARTGRAAGADLQPQNLPSAGPTVYKCGHCARHYGELDACPWCGALETDRKFVKWRIAGVEDALTIIKTGSLSAVEYFFGNALSTVSGCLRALIIPDLWSDLICSDYSSIEAVVLAALAGEEWRLEVFRTHGQIYLMSAAKITGTAFEVYERYFEETGSHHPHRATIGKIAELASGFGGSVGAWKQSGAGAFFNDDQIQAAVKAWRKESPAIVEFWGGQSRNYRPEFYGIEGAAVQAIMHPGREFEYRGIKFLVQQDKLYCRLLSGRYLTYHSPRLEPRDNGWSGLQISFESWNSNAKNGARGWIRMRTYGGRLTENIVQATARDILAHAIVNLERSGYPVVVHVHDEIVSEIPENYGSIEEFESIMSTMPTWAAGWPVKAKGGWRGKRYRKD